MVCADINDFIARSDDEEPAESERETSADEEEQPSANEEEEPEKHMASRARGAGQNRRAAAARTLGAAAKVKQTEKARQVAKQRRLLRAGSGAGSTPQGPPEPQGLEDSSSGDEKSLSARSARLKGKQPAAPEPPDANEPGPSAEHARWRPTQQPIQQPARHAALAAALADDSEEEHEEAEVDLQSLSRGSKRRRLRKASGADVTPVLGAAGAANRPAVRTRTRTLPSKPSILEQLKQHQVRLVPQVSSMECRRPLPHCQTEVEGLPQSCLQVINSRAHNGFLLWHRLRTPKAGVMGSGARRTRMSS